MCRCVCTYKNDNTLILLVDIQFPVVRLDMFSKHLYAYVSGIPSLETSTIRIRYVVHSTHSTTVELRFKNSYFEGKIFEKT